MYLYFAEHKVKNSPVKIGVAADIEKRMRQLSTASPWGIKHFACVFFDSTELAYEAERLLHKMFRDCRMNGEWFESINGVKAINFLFDMYSGDTDNFEYPISGEDEVCYSIAGKNISEWGRQIQENDIRMCSQQNIQVLRMAS